MEKVLKDLLPSRETQIQAPTTATRKSEEIFAVCLETDDVDLLVPLKIYQVSLRGEYVRVIDEKGEPAVYPRGFFLPLQLTQEAVNTLTKIYPQAA